MENPEFYYQLGTNYLALKKYAEAEQNFQKAVVLEPKQRWYWNGLYDVYYQTRVFDKAIPIVEKLVVFDINMKEDLASLYMNTNQFEKAKKVLDLEIENHSLTKENLEIASERFKLGQSNAIEMRQAETSYSNSLYRYVQAQFNTRSAVS